MVIRPRAELQCAVLLVEGKMLHLDLTGTFVDGWGKPVDAAIEKNDSVGVDRNLVGSIGTKRRKKREKSKLFLFVPIEIYFEVGM